MKVKIIIEIEDVVIDNIVAEMSEDSTVDEIDRAVIDYIKTNYNIDDEKWTIDL